MAEFVAAQASVLIVPTLGKGANNFQTRLKADLERVKASVEVEVKAETSKMLAEIAAAKKAAELTPIELRVDDKGVTRQITEIRHKYEDVARDFKKGLTLNLSVVGLSQLTQLGPALAAVNQSIVALSQSALLLPGLISGIGAAAATTLTGVHGLAAAFKAQSAASKDASDAARQQADANRAVQDATNSLSRSVKDARRNIEDLNDQLRDAPIDEAEAMLNLQQAQYEASQRLGKTYFEQQQDLLRVAKAQNAVADSHKRGVRALQDSNEANAKGVTGADNVTSALDRLTKAQENAGKGTSQVKALGDAMGKLSPNAKAFFDSVVGLGPAWKALEGSVQDRMFAGLGDDLKSLADSDLPLVQRGMEGVAGAINGNLKTALSTLKSGSNKGFLENIFGNTASADHLLDRTIKPLLDSFLHLGSAGSSELPKLSAGLGDVLTRFDNFVNRADADGSLKKWIDAGEKAFKDLGNSLINIGSIMNSVNDAFVGGGGRGLLDHLATGTQKLAEFLKGAEGQQKLRGFFYEARVEMEKWKPVLADIPGILKNLSSASHEWSDMLLPFLKEAADLLKDHPGLVTTVLYAYLSWKTVSPIIGGVSTALRGLSTGMNFLTSQLGGTVPKVNTLSSSFSAMKDTVANNGGVISSIKNLAAALGPQILLGAATVLITYMTSQFISGMQEGTTALERQKAMADQLKESFDRVTGAATTASQAAVVNRLQDGKNAGTGQKLGNQLSQLPQGFDTPGLTKAITTGDKPRVDAMLSAIPGAKASDVEATDFWKAYGEDARKHGVSADDVARAINGEPDEVKKFSDWSDTKGNDMLGLGMGIGPKLSHDDLRGAKKAGLIDTPDLLDVQNQLPLDARKGSNIRGSINSALQDSISSRTALGQANVAQFGQVTLNPAGRDMFGADAQVAKSADGVTIKTSGPISDQLKKDIKDRGGDALSPGDGDGAPVDGTLIKLHPDRAKQYVTGFAGGGLVSGPGTGTSDSILAALSNSEYVMPSHAVGAYGTDAMDALRSGKLDPKLLKWLLGGGMPGFAGGYMPPIDKPPVAPVAPVETHWADPDPAPDVQPNFSSPDKPLMSGLGDLASGFGQSAARAGSTAGHWFGDVGRSAGHWFGTTLPNSLGMDPLTADSATRGANGGFHLNPSTPLRGSGLGGLPNVWTGKGSVAPPPLLGGWFGGGGGNRKVPMFAKPVRHGGTNQVGPNPAGGGISVHGGTSPNAMVPGAAQGYTGPSTAASTAPFTGFAPPGGGGAPAFAPPGGGSSPFGVGGAGGPGGLGGSGGLGGLLGGLFGGGGGGGGAPIDLANIGQQIGQIALQFLGGLFGIDFSQITQIFGAITGGFKGGKGGKGGGLFGNLFGPQGLDQDGLNSMVSDPAGYYSGGGGTPGVAGIQMPGASVTYTRDVLQSLGLQPLFTNPQGGGAPSIPGWVQSFVQQYGGPSLVAGSTPHGSLHGNVDTSGYAVDVTGNPEDMDRFAAFLLQNPDLSAQMIHKSASGQPMGVAGGANVSGSYYTTPGGTYDDEGTMVHWAPSFRPGAYQSGQQPGQQQANTASAISGSGQSAVYQAMHQAGFDDSQWNSLNQIVTHESHWDSGATNPSSGAFGLFQFLGSTRDHYLPGATDDATQAMAGLQYIKDRYGSPEAAWQFWQQHNWYAKGGIIKAAQGILSGPGTGTSDSIIAALSNGEAVIPAGKVQANPALFRGMIDGNIDPRDLDIPHHDDGFMPPIPIVQPAPQTGGGANEYGQAGGQLPPPSQTATAQQAPGAAPTPVGMPGVKPINEDDAPQGESVNMDGSAKTPSGQAVGDAIGGAFAPKGGGGAGSAAPGADGPTGSKRDADPRSILGAAPKNYDHNLPALSAGIQGAAGTIGGLASMAASAAISAGTMGAGGVGAGAASSGIQAGAQIAGMVGTDALNILSSLLVGNVTGGTTQNAYGAPVLPQGPPQSGGGGPQTVNNYGDIHTANYDEFYKGQQRREAQQQAPILPNR